MVSKSIRSAFATFTCLLSGFCKVSKWLDADLEEKAKISSFCEHEHWKNNEGYRITVCVDAEKSICPKYVCSGGLPLDEWNAYDCCISFLFRCFALGWKNTPNSRTNKPKVFRRIGIERSSKVLRQISYEAASQLTLQNSTENAMFEHRRVSRASSFRTNAKKQVHYFASSVFAFKSNEIIKLMMPDSH